MFYKELKEINVMSDKPPKTIPFMCEVNINLRTLCPHCKGKIGFNVIIPAQGGDIEKLIESKEPSKEFYN